jgi:8-oxo-dGTP pyrophosphatase MutT (NUDIX family)
MTRIETDKGKRTVACRTLYGGRKNIPAEKLTFRPSVYAILRKDEKILLLRMRSTGAYCLPGGGVELGETIEAGLIREVKEETGIDIAVGEFAFFKEDFFYYDPLDKAFHSFMFFYHCTPASRELIPDDQVQDLEAEKPRWVDVESLSAGAFYHNGEIVMDILRSGI